MFLAVLSILINFSDDGRLVVLYGFIFILVVRYGRGARMVDFMAEDGIVGQYAGSQAREVLMTMEEWAAAQGEEPLPPDPLPRRLKINPHAEEIVADDSEDEDEPIS